MDIKLKKFTALKDYVKMTENEMLVKSEIFNLLMQKRRTIRDFSSEPIDQEIINNCIKAAGSAPSGEISSPGIL